MSVCDASIYNVTYIECVMLCDKSTMYTLFGTVYFSDISSPTHTQYMYSTDM